MKGGRYAMKNQLYVYEEPKLEIMIFAEKDFLILSGNEVTNDTENGGIGLPDFSL